MRIKHLLEELQRHDPDKYLDREVSLVLANSARGSCVAIEFAGMNNKTKELDERVDELSDCIQEINENLKSLGDDPKLDDYAKAVKRIHALIINSEAT